MVRFACVIRQLQQRMFGGVEVNKRCNLPSVTSHQQRGSVLLEALIAVLLFSIGILAIVAMQGTAVQITSDAKYRADAALLANQLIGEMWASDRAPDVLKTKFQGGAGTNGTGYTTWLAKVQTTLPGTAANSPVVTVNEVQGGLASSPSTAEVNIQLWWQLPSAAANSGPHQYSVVTRIGG